MPKYAVLVSPQKIQIENRNRRKLSSHEIRATVKYAGVCKTDIAIFSGDYSVPLPIVLGHEWIGEVIEVADKSNDKLLGKRITAEINNSCAANQSQNLCVTCERNMPNHCITRSVTGIIKYDGAFAEEIIVPARVAFEIPNEISDDNAVFIEPLAAAIRTFDITPIKKGDFLVVLGAGKLGMLVALVAKTFGADVLLLSRSIKSRELLKKVNLDLTEIKDFNKIKQYVFDKTNGLGADMVVDATGDPNSIKNSLNLVRPRGVLSLKSTPGVPLDDFNITKFVVDEITLQGTRCGSFKKAISLLIQNNIPLKNLITKTYLLEDCADAIEYSKSNSGKILIKPN